MAGTLADIQAQNTALIAAVKAEDDVVDSAIVLINGQVATLADIKAQLAAKNGALVVSCMVTRASLMKISRANTGSTAE